MTYILSALAIAGAGFIGYLYHKKQMKAADAAQAAAIAATTTKAPLG